MITSGYRSYDELPLFLNAKMVAQVLGVSPSSGYELMHEPGFPVLKVGSRMVVPKEQFIRWVQEHTGNTTVPRCKPRVPRWGEGWGLPPWVFGRSEGFGGFGDEGQSRITPNSTSPRSAESAGTAGTCTVVGADFTHPRVGQAEHLACRKRPPNAFCGQKPAPTFPSRPSPQG